MWVLGLSSPYAHHAHIHTPVYNNTYTCVPACTNTFTLHIHIHVHLCTHTHTQNFGVFCFFVILSSLWLKDSVFLFRTAAQKQSISYSYVVVCHGDRDKRRFSWAGMGVEWE